MATPATTYPPSVMSVWGGFLGMTDADIMATPTPTNYRTMALTVPGLITAMAAEDNPYTFAEFYNPDNEVNELDERYRSFVGCIATLDEFSLWRRMIDEVSDRVDDILGDTDDETELSVDAFKEKAKDRLFESKQRIMAGMFDINAVVSTAFPAALALGEDQYLNDVDSYEADLNLKEKTQRALVYGQAVESMSRLLQLRVAGQQTTVEIAKQKGLFDIAAYTDYVKDNLDADVEGAFWQTSILTRNGSALQLGAGIAPAQGQLSRKQEVLTGIFNTASLITGLIPAIMAIA